MTRSDLISILAKNFPALTAKDADLVVKEIIDAIGEALARGDRVELRGFGVFSVHQRQSRIARNPKTGEKVVVPAKAMPHFKPGTVLSAVMRTKGKQLCPCSGQVVREGFEIDHTVLKNHE